MKLPRRGEICKNIRYIYNSICILLREAPLPLDCVSKVVVCCCLLLLFVTDLGSIPLGLQQGGHAYAYWYFDAKIMFLLFLTKNGPVSNRLSHKDFRIGGSKNYSFYHSPQRTVTNPITILLNARFAPLLCRVLSSRKVPQVENTFDKVFFHRWGGQSEDHPKTPDYPARNGPDAP